MTSPSITCLRDPSQTETSGGARGLREQNRVPAVKALRVELFVGENVLWREGGGWDEVGG